MLQTGQANMQRQAGVELRRIILGWQTGKQRQAVSRHADKGMQRKMHAGRSKRRER
jgi:hypothetical protein